MSQTASSKANPLSEELEVALSLASEASRVVMSYYATKVQVEWKGQDGPVTVADRASCDLIVKGLSQRFPQDSILSEEMPVVTAGPRRLWCVDPLDGTREFTEEVGQFAVMIGLAIDGESVLGVVEHPTAREIYYAAKGGGAWMEKDGVISPLKVSKASTPSVFTIAVSRSHRSQRLEAVKASLGISKEIASGSVGLKCGLLIQGLVDAYIHPSAGCHMWDSCGPEAIVKEAGGMMTDCLGQKIAYGLAGSALKQGLVASNGQIHDLIIEHLKPVMG